MQRFGRDFLRGSLSSAIAAGVGGICGYLTRRLMANGLDIDEYAFFYSMYSLLMIVFAVLRLGSSDALLYMLPGMLQERKFIRAGQLFGFACRYQVIVFGAAAAVLALATPFLVRWYFPMPADPAAIWCFLPYLPLFALESALFFTLNSLKQFDRLNLLKIVQSVLLLAGTAVALRQPGLCGVIIVYSVAAAIVCAAAWPSRSGLAINRCAVGLARRVMKSGVVFAVLSLGAPLLCDWGTVTLACVGDADEVAAFNIAAPVAMIVYSLIGIPMAFTPLSLELYRSGEVSRLRRVFALIDSGAFAMMLAALPVFIFGGGWLISVLFAPKYAGAVWCCMVLTEAALVALLVQFRINFLNAAGCLRESMFSSIPALLLSLLLFPVLGAWQGATGTATAALITFVLWHFECARRCRGVLAGHGRRGSVEHRQG
ncbi:MAG: hypothetical protein PHI35_01130 [Victivallaceae bacterium]|nr:hypothetical protein [Victivallaceae bacterium]